MIRSQALRDSAGHPDAHCMWRPVVGWFGMYEISALGEVRSVARVMPCSNGKRRTCPSVVLKKGIVSGYERVQLCRSGKEVSALVHRLVAEAFIPGVGEVVRHIDGVKTHNNVDNLCWGSCADNAHDKRAHGKHLSGERHPRATMTADSVRAIRKMYAEGKSQLQICRETGLGRGAVGFAVRGETWRDVQ